MGNFKAGNRASVKERESMDRLYALIATCGQQDLQEVADDMLIRKTFGRDETRSNAASSKPRRKYTVDDSGMVRNSRLSNSPMQCNENNPDYIKGSCDNLFNGNSQTERCASESNRGPMQRTPGFPRRG